MLKYTFLLLSTFAASLGASAQVLAESTSSIERHRIWISATNPEGVYHETLIGYIQGATLGVDPGYDGYLLGGNQIKIYSLINENQFAIQARPLPFVDTDVVNIGMQFTQSQEVTIALNRKDGLFDTQAVFLHDSQENTCTNLAVDSYTFTSEIGTFNNRFSIIYQNEVLSTADWQTEETLRLAVQPQQWIGVESKQPMKKIEVYSLQMKQIGNWELNAAQSWESQSIQLASGIYFMKIDFQNGESELKRFYY